MCLVNFWLPLVFSLDWGGGGMGVLLSDSGNVTLNGVTFSRPYFIEYNGKPGKN